MGQPRKLSPKQRVVASHQRMLAAKLAQVRNDLQFIRKEMNGGCVNFDTWRWAALEVFRRLQDASEFPPSDLNVEQCVERALMLAREAQLAMNFSQVN